MKRKLIILILFIVIAAAVSVLPAFMRNRVTIEAYSSLSRPVKISPDYTGIIIPANIAPLNFVIREPGTGYLVKIHTSGSEVIEVFSRTGKVIIPSRRWKKLLEVNRGEKLYIDVFVKDTKDLWSRYETIANTIAKEPIDSHIAYRLIKPIYNIWESIGVFQRNLETYEQSVVLHGQSMSNGCVNCHSFHNNDPESMFIGIRSAKYASSAVLTRNKEAYKIGTKFGYTTWHPSGKVAAYSINKVRQFFHNAGSEVRDVIDIDSAICYYDIESKTAKTTEALKLKDRLETYPVWSADGKYLYYCSAPNPEAKERDLPPENFDEVKYDLMRISYDIKSDKWGEPEMVLSAEKTGLSILLPRVSPDGRFLLFTMCDYGCFPIYQPSSDLYLMDLRSREYHRLDINSEYSDSWHSFSSNGRWIAFSSKRQGGLYTRTFFSYMDQNGKVHKPFVMPQKDPEFYDSFLKTYSVPELITGPIKVKHRTLARAARSSEKIEVQLPITMASPGAQDPGPWQERE